MKTSSSWDDAVVVVTSNPERRKGRFGVSSAEIFAPNHRALSQTTHSPHRSRTAPKAQHPQHKKPSTPFSSQPFDKKEMGSKNQTPRDERSLVVVVSATESKQRIGKESVDSMESQSPSPADGAFDEAELDAVLVPAASTAPTRSAVNHHNSKHRGADPCRTTTQTTLATTTPSTSALASLSCVFSYAHGTKSAASRTTDQDPKNQTTTRRHDSQLGRLNPTHCHAQKKAAAPKRVTMTKTNTPAQGNSTPSQTPARSTTRASPTPVLNEAAVRPESGLPMSPSASAETPNPQQKDRDTAQHPAAGQSTKHRRTESAGVDTVHTSLNDELPPGIKGGSNVACKNSTSTPVESSPPKPPPAPSRVHESPKQIPKTLVAATFAQNPMDENTSTTSALTDSDYGDEANPPPTPKRRSSLKIKTLDESLQQQQKPTTTTPHKRWLKKKRSDSSSVSFGRVIVYQHDLVDLGDESVALGQLRRSSQMGVQTYEKYRRKTNPSPSPTTRGRSATVVAGRRGRSPSPIPSRHSRSPSPRRTLSTGRKRRSLTR